MKLNLRGLALTCATLAFLLAQRPQPLAAEPENPAAAKPETKAETKPEAKPAPKADKPAATAEKKESKPMDAKTMSPVVVMKTSLGTIKIRLAKDKAPLTVENFLKYVDQKFYDGTIFHRVIDGFMIQGGGFTPDMVQKPVSAPIKLEAQSGLTNKRGTIAMARTGDPNSATSQFFINVVDNANLDYPKPDGNGYAVFGEVTEGMDVVDKIKAVKTGNKSAFQNVPVEVVTIESVRLEGK